MWKRFLLELTVLVMLAACVYLVVKHYIALPILLAFATGKAYELIKGELCSLKNK